MRWAGSTGRDCCAPGCSGATRPGIEGAQTTLRERGGWAVFVARFTAFLRAVMPGLAGMSRMPYGRFLVFNAAGGLVWGVGRDAARVSSPARPTSRWSHVLGQVSAVLAVVLVGGAAFAWWRHRRRNRARNNVRRSMRF